MDFVLTEAQQMIADSANDWLAHHYDLRQRAASLQRDGGNPAVWQAMAELGWLGLVLPEHAGGMELGALEAGLLAQALGRHLVVEPWLDCCLEAARLLAQIDSARLIHDVQAALLPLHTLKGLAGTIGAERLQALARTAEIALKKAPDAWEVLGPVVEEATGLGDEIAALVATLAAPPAV